MKEDADHREHGRDRKRLDDRLPEEFFLIDEEAAGRVDTLLRVDRIRIRGRLPALNVESY